jgi:hypothetical protein
MSEIVVSNVGFLDSTYLYDEWIGRYVVDVC